MFLCMCVYIFFNLYIFNYKYAQKYIYSIPFTPLYKTNLHNSPLTNLFCFHIHIFYFNALGVF